MVNSIAFNSAVAWLAFVAGPVYEELFAGFGGSLGMYPLATKIFLSTCACWGVIPLGMAIYWLGFPMESRRHYRVMTCFGRVSLAAMVVLFLVGAYGYLPGKLGSVDVPASESRLDAAADTGSAGECQ